MWSIEEEQILIKEFKIKNNEELSILLNRTPRAIQHRLTKLGLSRGRINPVNENFFKTWSEDMAYILGFTLADGNISVGKDNSYRLVYGVSKKDRSVLEYISKCLQYNASKIKDTIEFRNNVGHETSRLRIGSKIIAEDLSQYHIIPRKTGIEKLPNIPIKYRSNFLLGLFDGDGCICVCHPKTGQLSFSIVSASKDFLQSVKDILGFNFGNVRNKDSCYVWSVTRQSEIDELKCHMYNNYNFCLDRKRKKFKW